MTKTKKVSRYWFRPRSYYEITFMENQGWYVTVIKDDWIEMRKGKTMTLKPSLLDTLRGGDNG